MSLAEQVRKADLAITGKKFCSSCQSMRPANAGQMIGTKVRRWKCALCLNKASLQKYKRKEKND